jgi:hypothetical protein
MPDSPDSCCRSLGALPSFFCSLKLKVHKCEIFDRSDFHDFYTIKPLWEGDFGVKIKFVFNKFMGSFGGREIPYAYAQSNYKKDFC